MARSEEQEFSKSLEKLSKQELRELVMINAYKLAMARSQIDAIIEVLIKKKITTYENIWKLTHERFQHDQEQKKTR